MIGLLERRLDAVIFRAKFAPTPFSSRQLVSHGHVAENGKRITIPSYLVKPGEVIALRESSRSLDKFKATLEANGSRVAPKWLDFDRNILVAKVVALPDREDIDLPIEEHLIVELYSK
jgi:small subunit ribosomal protein S4